MDFADNSCNIGLSLGLGPKVQSDNCIKKDQLSELRVQKKKEDDSLNRNKYNNKVFPSLTLGLSDDHHQVYQIQSKNIESADFHLQASSPSAVSSFSNSRSSSIRKERDSMGEEVELEAETKVSGRVGDLDEDGNPRKKLRLTKEQSAVLDDSFKEHASLNPKQKQELARKLNLRTRQVEVWFQNRRARTKLKQTEMDCELLKKSCETLTEENKRLQKEIQELKSMKTSPRGPFYMQLPATTLTICPSCERICGGGGGGGDSNGSPPATPFFIGSKAHHFYKSNHPFTHSSAAY